MSGKPGKVSALPAPAQELYRLACAARERSYSPYSKCKVGAAIRMADGRAYAGCNIENSSYGGSICAERTAVFKAISEQGKAPIAEVMVVTDAAPAWPPCGFCRQVLAEFAAGSVPVHAANLQGEVRSSTFGQLMPEAFTPEHLGK